jgi:hypothetical protein
MPYDDRSHQVITGQDEEVDQIRALPRSLLRNEDEDLSSLSPCQQIPLEIWKEIFMQCLPDDEFIAISAHSAPVLLARVCHPWRVLVLSDVLGPAWAQSPGSGWASAGSGLQKPKPDPELRAGPGLGLVGLEPGLMSQRGNWLKYYIEIQFSMPECTHGQPYNSTHHESCQVACARNCWPTGSPKQVIYNIIIINFIPKSF